VRTWLERAGFDPRFSSLVLALALVWGALAFATDGLFLSPRNLYNLSIQTCVVADHVVRHGLSHRRAPDRPVGRLAGGVHRDGDRVRAGRMARRRDAGAWLLSIAAGVACGMLLGAFQGWWTAYRGLPAFVVTLAGYLMFRGAAFLVADGQTLAPLSTAYQSIGGWHPRIDRSGVELGAWGRWHAQR
jgi:D-xylose transport system permease protein